MKCPICQQELDELLSSDRNSIQQYYCTNLATLPGETIIIGRVVANVVCHYRFWPVNDSIDIIVFPYKLTWDGYHQARNLYRWENITMHLTNSETQLMGWVWVASVPEFTWTTVEQLRNKLQMITVFS